MWPFEMSTFFLGLATFYLGMATFFLELATFFLGMATFFKDRKILKKMWPNEFLKKCGQLKCNNSFTLHYS